MSESKKTITYKCEFCGKENTKFFRKDLKYRFCNTTCNGKSLVVKFNKRDRTGTKNPAWKGGRRVNYGGYIQIYKPEHPRAAKRLKLVFEHHLVMEQKLGRYLKKGEVVHHLNGIKDDNRIENLQLLKNQAEHAKMHYSLEKHQYGK